MGILKNVNGSIGFKIGIVQSYHRQSELVISNT
jgi:hypothetical protein